MASTGEVREQHLENKRRALTKAEQRTLRKEVRYRTQDAELHEFILRCISQKIVRKVCHKIQTGRNDDDLLRIQLRLPKLWIYHVTARCEWEHELQSRVKSAMYHTIGIRVSRLSASEGRQIVNALDLVALTFGTNCIRDDLLLDRDIDEMNEMRPAERAFLAAAHWLLCFAMFPLMGAGRLAVRSAKGLRARFLVHIEP